MADLLQKLDDAIASLFSNWDGYTLLLGIAIVAFVTHTLLTATDPDIHPLILARQSYPDRVRNAGESAIYRATDVPPGSPLRSGLGVRLPTDKPYSAGRDGDLRYIWMAVKREIKLPTVPGSTVQEAKQGKILTVMGRELTVNHDIAETDKEIKIFGSYLAQQGRKRVAIYLPNSIEFLETIFGIRTFFHYQGIA